MDIKQIINEFRSLESTTHKDNTYNVISLFDMLHKLGASKERYPMFFIATNDAPNNIPNTIRELLSVEYDMECTINEVSRNSILRKFAIITLRSSDKHLQSCFIEIFAMMLMKMPQQPSKQEFIIELKNMMNKAGFNNTAFSIGIRLLKAKGFITTKVDSDFNGN